MRIIDIMSIEQISSYLERQEKNIPYIDPEFWISGQYLSTENTSVLHFVELGESVVAWLFRYVRQNPKDFTRIMILCTCLPTSSSDRAAVVHASTVYEKLYASHGDVDHYIKNHDEDLHITEEMIEQMSEFALRFPYLIDVFKAVAHRDLQSGGRAYLSMQEYIGAEVEFVPRMFEFIKLFPKIFSEVYTDILYDETGLVSDFKIKPQSSRFIQINEKYNLL